MYKVRTGIIMTEKNIKISVVSPEKTIYTGDCEYVSIPGANGYFGVLYNHAPLISKLDVGIVEIRNEGKILKIVVDGGFVEVKANNINILASSGDLKENIDQQKAIKKLDELLGNQSNNNEELKKAKIRVAVHKN